MIAFSLPAAPGHQQPPLLSNSKRILICDKIGSLFKEKRACWLSLLIYLPLSELPIAGRRRDEIARLTRNDDAVPVYGHVKTVAFVNCEGQKKGAI